MPEISCVKNTNVIFSNRELGTTPFIKASMPPKTLRPPAKRNDTAKTANVGITESQSSEANEQKPRNFINRKNKRPHSHQILRALSPALLHTLHHTVYLCQPVTHYRPQSQQYQVAEFPHSSKQVSLCVCIKTAPVCAVLPVCFSCACFTCGLNRLSQDQC